jgi:hypothetical protein
MQQTLQRATFLPNTAIILVVEPQLILKSVDVLTTDTSNFRIPKQSCHRRDISTMFKVKFQYLTGSKSSKM